MNPTHPLAARAIHFRWMMLAWLALVAGCATVPASRTQPPLATPSQLYGQLFADVQMAQVFPDGKTFVDAVPRRSPARISAAYERERTAPAFDLRQFVLREFELPKTQESGYHTQPGEDIRTHIDRLWDVLTRQPHSEPAYSTRLSLPKAYVVPGGRFNEMYYWDSYFTMVGLAASGRHDLVRAMCDDFAFLIEHYGHIPNGTRTYYLSRSQPPFFAAMVELLAAHDGEQTYARYRDALQKEHDFWMEGSGNLGQGAAHRRVVRLPDGSILNRYWDDRDTPREESWREDVLTAQRSQRPAAEVYRNLRAAAESGWDFSSRWFADDRTLATIRTVDFVPVDLNSLLYRLEGTLAHAWQSVDAMRAAQMRQAAERRRMAMHKYLWNESAGAFTDYDWRNKVISKNVTAAAGSALFFGVANDEQAAATAQAIERTLLAEYGIATTAHNTGEQWDAPNGWAPLQWIVIDGLHQYHHDELARKIATRWIQRNLEVFRTTGKLVEKYDVMSGGGAGGGGEYPLQDGFGWTNGVLRALLERYPQQ